MTSSNRIEIKLNGEEKLIEAGSTVENLLDEMAPAAWDDRQKQSPRGGAKRRNCAAKLLRNDDA